MAALYITLLEAMAGDYEVLSPEALTKKLRPPRKASEIDDEWIAGLRKGWRMLVKEAKSYEGRNASMPSIPDVKLLYEHHKAAQRFLKRVETYLENLRSMLLIGKGMYSVPPKGSKAKATMAQPTKKVAKNLEEALQALRKGHDWARLIADNFDPNPPVSSRATEYPKGDYFEKVWGDRAMEHYGWAWKESPELVDETMKKVDDIISRRLLPTLKAMIKRWADEKGRVDMGSFEPDVLHVGGFTVIFRDTPDDPSKFQREVPSNISGKKSTMGYRSPGMRSRAAKLVKKAAGFMKRAGVGYLASGRLFFEPERYGEIGPDPSRARKGYVQAAGTYHRGGDFINLYYVSDFIVSTIIHESGHRYWFKYMSSEDKRNFERFFGKSKAASSYGSTHPEEDFAELFAAYVMGKEWSKAGGIVLDRDQRQRMEQFLGRKRKLESTMQHFEALLEAIAVGKTFFRVPTPAEVMGEPSEYTPPEPSEKAVARAKKRLEKKPRKKKQPKATSTGSSVSFTRGEMVPKRLKDHEIDETWVKGIRKWFKSQCIKAKGYTGWTPSSFTGSLDETGQPALDAVETLTKELEVVGGALDTLARDLLLNKGFWVAKGKRQSPEQTREKRTIKKYATRAVRADVRQASKMALDMIDYNKIGGKVGQILAEAKNELVDARTDIESEGDDLQADADMLHPDLYEKGLKKMSARLVKAVTTVEKIVSGKLLRYLGTLIKKHADPGSGKYSYKGTSFAPEVVHVGRFNLVFDDLPTDPTQPQFFAAVPHPSPERTGMAYGGAGVDTSALKTPQLRDRVIREVKKALALLRREGLTFLAYGDLHKRHPKAYDIYTMGGMKGGSTIATYSRINDYIDLYGDAIEADEIVHELGHRYYYKFMSAEDRHNFDRFFRKVPATSTYGGSSPAEDFAEAFRSYVARKKMTKAQRQRFEQFLGRKRRKESLEGELRNLLAWVRYSEGDGMVEA